MELFNTNPKNIEDELSMIKENLYNASYKKIKENFNLLEQFFLINGIVSDIDDEEAFNILRREKKIVYENGLVINSLTKSFIKNFIEHKEFHKNFSANELDRFEKYSLNEYYSKNTYLRQSEIIDIMCDYLEKEFKCSDILYNLIKEGRLYKVDFNNSGMDQTAGLATLNTLTNNNYILVSDSKKLNNADIMRIIMHEFGHVMDNIERCQRAHRFTKYEYFLTSTYSEVYSMFYEYNFLKYLLDNNILIKDTLNQANEFFAGTDMHFYDMNFVTSLEDKKIINQRYMQEKEIEKHIVVDDDGELYVPTALSSDLFKLNIYSYGGVFATYFYNLKKQDEEEFNRKFNIFKNLRFDFFDPSIFEKIGTNDTKILDIYENELRDLTTNKKYILK